MVAESAYEKFLLSNQHQQLLLVVAVAA